MKRRIIALLLAACLILSTAPVQAGAVSGQQISAGNVTVTAGNTASVTLKAENFSNVAALDVYIYYDASIFSVSRTSNGSILSGAQTSTNTAEAGTVKLSTMALNGMNGSGNLLTVYFTTTADTAPGTYPITVAVGRAYDGALNPATIESVNGSITVNKPAETESFSLSGSVNKSKLQKDQLLTYKVRNSGSRKFASGDFTVEYDHTLFAFETLTLNSGLTVEGAVYSVNSATLGQVRLTYAATNPVNPYELFTLTLKVIADVDTSTVLKAQASNMYREDLSMYLPGSTSMTLTLQKIPEVIDYPNAFLQTEELVVGRQNSSVFLLEEGAGVAAADFTLTYDPAVLKCISVTAADEAIAQGGMVVVNDNFTDGTIRFSYLNMSAYAETDLPLVRILWEPQQSPGSHYQIASSSVGVVDATQNALTLEHVTSSGHIFVRTVIPPVCTVDGRTNFACACGESYDIEPVSMLGHKLVHTPAREETCTEAGWEAYDSCSRCDYTTYVEIPALNHGYIHHEAKAPNCTEIGWEAYDTCGRCNYTTYKEIPMLGHNYIHHNTQEPTCTEKGYTLHSCADCGESYRTDITEKLPHDYTEDLLVCGQCGHTRVTLTLDKVVLKPTVAGIYFKGNLVWDQEDTQILACGIAVSVENPLPVADDSDPSCMYTQGSVSALITDILDADNTDAQNKKNAKMLVYARAYVKLADGRIVYSDSIQACLQQVVMAADSNWNTLADTQKAALTAMYDRFSSVMKAWQLPNIKA